MLSFAILRSNYTGNGEYGQQDAIKLEIFGLDMSAATIHHSAAGKIPLERGLPV
jgi:hypothetical protein